MRLQFSGLDLSYLTKCTLISWMIFVTSTSSASTCIATLTNSRWVGKTVILDTNVILDDPQAIYKFPGARVIVPGIVHEEIDNNKTNPAVSYAARSFSRDFYELLKNSKDAADVPLGGDSTLTYDLADHRDQLAGTSLLVDKADNAILGAALYYWNANRADRNGQPDSSVVMVSNDLNVLIKAKGLGLNAERFDQLLGLVAPKPQGDFLKEFELSDAELEKFVTQGSIEIPKSLYIHPNEFVAFHSPSVIASDHSVGRYIFNRERPERSRIVILPKFTKSEKLPGAPLNLEQSMALDLLLDPTVELVIMSAKAGTGKTFLSLLAAIATQNNYQRVFVSRPTVHMGGRDPGAVPGRLDEKYAEWQQPIIDNLNMLMSLRADLRQSAQAASNLVSEDDAYVNAPSSQYQRNRPKKGRPQGGPVPRTANRAFEKPAFSTLPPGFKLLALEFIRGRSIANSLIIVDEVQNTNIHEIKTTLTRVGGGTKIVIMGDPSQIDSPYLNALNNGLSVAEAVFTDPNLTNEERSRIGVIKLVEGVRSPLSDLASRAFDSLSAGGGRN